MIPRFTVHKQSYFSLIIFLTHLRTLRRYGTLMDATGRAERGTYLLTYVHHVSTFRNMDTLLGSSTWWAIREKYSPALVDVFKEI